MKVLFTFILLSIIMASCSSGKKQYMLVGTYTSGISKGIYVYEFNGDEKTATLVDSIAASNPSFLAVSPDQKYVYAVSEENASTGGGSVIAYSFNKDNGELTELNKQATLGDHPCYVTVDKTGKWVIAGNYSSGSISILPVNADGSLANRVNVVQHEGHGPDSSRQSSPHVHATVLSPDNNFLFVPDLGIDKVMAYRFDEKTGMITPTNDTAAWVQDGSGPRHFTFHPSGDYAYLIQELSSTVTAFKYKDGKLDPQQIISSVPKEYNGPRSSADIHVSPDGKFLYASNRDSSNTIAIFKIDESTGKLTTIGHQSTMGSAPRNFNFDPSGDYLLVGNQKNDEIVVFKVDHETGLLADTGQRISVGSPVCIQWVK